MGATTGLPAAVVAHAKAMGTDQCPSRGQLLYIVARYRPLASFRKLLAIYRSDHECVALQVDGATGGLYLLGTEFCGTRLPQFC